MKNKKKVGIFFSVVLITLIGIVVLKPKNKDQIIEIKEENKFEYITEENVDEYLAIYGEPDYAFGGPSEPFVNMTNKDYMEYLKDKVNQSDFESKKYDLTETYHFGGEDKKTTVSMVFQKINNSEEEANEIMKEYDKAYKDTNYPEAVHIDDFEYVIYKFDMYYNDINVDYATPILIQVKEDGDDLIVNGVPYANKPYWLGVEKNGDHYTYIMAGLKERTKDKICYLYTFPVTYKNPAEIICLE